MFPIQCFTIIGVYALNITRSLLQAPSDAWVHAEILNDTIEDEVE